MTLACPRCECAELRLHGTLYRIESRPRFRLFGPTVTVRHVLGHDCSCRKCFYAFTTISGIIRDAPAQTLHEALGVNLRQEKSGETGTSGSGREERTAVALDQDVRPDPREPVKPGRHR